MITRIAQFFRGISDFFRRIYGQLPRPVQTILAWISNQIIGTKMPPKKRAVKASSNITGIRCKAPHFSGGDIRR